MIKTPIIITSINHPTEAIKAFAKLDNFELIVVGDLKSPDNWKLDNVKLKRIVGDASFRTFYRKKKARKNWWKKSVQKRTKNSQTKYALLLNKICTISLSAKRNQEKTFNCFDKVLRKRIDVFQKYYIWDVRDGLQRLHYDFPYSML